MNPSAYELDSVLRLSDDELFRGWNGPGAERYAQIGILRGSMQIVAASLQGTQGAGIPGNDQFYRGLRNLEKR